LASRIPIRKGSLINSGVVPQGPQLYNSEASGFTHKLGPELGNGAPSLGRVATSPEAAEYREKFENTQYYNRPLFSKEQVQGAINLSSVGYQYDPETQCGPRVAACHNGGTPYQPHRDARGQQLPRYWATSTQLRFMRPKGSTTGPPNRCPSFSGIIFCNEPTKDPKIFLINQEQAFQWLRHMLYSVDEKGQDCFTPDKILSTEGLLEKGEISSIRDCHYFTIHEPAITKKDGKMADHDRRVWIEPNNASTQVFVCSGGLTKI
jgi:hypothetical protein